MYRNQKKVREYFLIVMAYPRCIAYHYLITCICKFTRSYTNKVFYVLRLKTTVKWTVLVFAQSRQRKNTCMNENCHLFSKWRRKNIHERGVFILITRINKVHVADPLLHTTNKNICTLNTTTDRGSSLKQYPDPLIQTHM